MRSFVARFNFTCNLIGNLPQSLIGHIIIKVNRNHEKAYKTKRNYLAYLT